MVEAVAVVRVPEAEKDASTIKVEAEVETERSDRSIQSGRSARKVEALVVILEDTEVEVQSRLS